MPTGHRIGYALGRAWGQLPRLAKLSVVILITGAVVAMCSIDGAQPPAANRTPPIVGAGPPPPRPADPRDAARGRAAFAVKFLRDTMKDPKSFEIEEAMFMGDDTGCYTFFARNSFNARTRGAAVFDGRQLLTHENGGVAFNAAWKKHCQGRDGERLTSYVKMFVL